MFWIYAATISAKVVKFKPCWNGTFEMNIGPSVRVLAYSMPFVSNLFPFHTEISIAVRKYGSDPKPAIFDF